MNTEQKTYPKAKSQAPAIWFILATIILDTTGLGIIIPIFPKLMQEITHQPLSVTAIYSGFLMFAFSLAQFICAPILGALSDQYGRKPVLILSIIGLGINYIILSLAPSLTWLFIGRLIGGMMAGSYTAAAAYISDISTEKTRPKNFGLLQAAFGAGFILGPVIGGAVGNFGVRAPFVIAAVFSLANAVYGVLVIPESLATKNRRRFSFRNINPIASIFYFRKYPNVALIMIIYFIFHLGESVFPSVWTFYTIEKFNWAPNIIGYSLGFFGLSLAICQSLLASPTVRILGTTKTIVIGAMITISGYIAYSLATQGWMLVALSPFFELGWLSITAILSVAVPLVPANEQGKFHGSLASLVSITELSGPLVMIPLFSFFSRSGTVVYFPGMPFLFSACLATIGLLLCWHWLSSRKQPPASIHK